MEKTAKEVLLNHIPANCYWEDMGNLVNCPEGYTIAAMEEYATQQNSQVKEELSALREENERLRKELAFEKYQVNFLLETKEAIIDNRRLDELTSLLGIHNAIKSALHPSHNTEEK